MSLNFHGESSFHQEAYKPARGYFAEGADSPETWIFRRMFMDAVIAARILQAQVEVDEDRIGAMGMSQGGGMAIWLGAWCPVIRAVCSDMPFLGGVDVPMLEKAYRYPLKELTEFMDRIPLGKERVANTLQYFDTAVQATRCRVPTQVSLGLKDPAVKPSQARHVYESLPGTKKLITYEGGHDWTPSMVENNRAWLVGNLR
jgi:cephalosporin-C deacetylase